jgi:energy-converting hydrogenase Eha subunit E
MAMMAVIIVGTIVNYILIKSIIKDYKRIQKAKRSIKIWSGQ